MFSHNVCLCLYGKYLQIMNHRITKALLATQCQQHRHHKVDTFGWQKINRVGNNRAFETHLILGENQFPMQGNFKMK